MALFKAPNNPRALDLTKSCIERSVCLDNILPIIGPLGKKLCAWCYESPARGPKYCGQDCATSARAWAYPQKEEGLNYLLMRQGFKCAICQYDYNPLILQLLQNGRVYDKPKDYLTQLSYWLVRRIKQKIPKEHKPEVDHIVPIYKGGVSLGLDNHQAICFTCHKTKTKSDLSGSRKQSK